MADDNTETVEQFVAEVTRPVMRGALGVSTQVISRAVAENRMPASWYLALREVCLRLGRDVPDHLFHMKPLTTQNANEVSGFQGERE